MSHQVLARKWRPRDFQSLVGQEHVVRALTHALSTQRLHHAYLFTGTRGVGKTTIARILAKSLNCERGLGPTPCGACGVCTEIDGGRFVDYIEMDAASNRGVDEMTQVLENAVYAPSAARYKVYVIDEVHMLTMHAFNAMLKTLEEPPAHIVFVLATTDPQKVPVTVLSRCLQFNLKNMTPPAITDHLAQVLTKEAIDFESQALPHIGRAAAGSMRDALSLLDQAIAYGGGQVTETAVREMLGVVDSRDLTRLLEALLDADGARLVALADEMQASNAPFERMLQDFAALLQRVALAQVGVVTDETQATDLNAYATQVSAEDLQVYYQIALHGARDLPLAADALSGFTMVLLRLLAFRPIAGADAKGLQPRGDGAARPARSVPRSPAAGVDGSGSAVRSASAAALPSGGEQPDSTTAAARPSAGAALSAATAARAVSAGSGSLPARAAALAAAAAVSARAGQRPSAIPMRPTTPSSAPASVSRPGARHDDSTVPTRPPRKENDLETASGRSTDAGPASAAGSHDSAVVLDGQQGATPDVTTTQVADAPFEGDWPALAGRLALGGLAQQVLLQSELLGFDAQSMRIRVPIRQLADASVVAKVREGLAHYFQTSIELSVEVGAIVGQTAASVALQRQAARLSKAREVIDSDPFVQSLISDFGARVVPESVQPIDGA